MAAALRLTRSQILAFRRRVSALDERLPFSGASLRRAAWAGLTDSMPRAALLSIHARVRGAKPTSWDHASLVQVWGPRFSTYVVPGRDHAFFTVGRYPDDARGRRVAETMAELLQRTLGAERMTDREAGQRAGVGNSLRYATTTGTVLIRWEGARAPVIWNVPRPEIDPLAARLELARRYLHVFGAGTAASFARWGGVGAKEAADAFDGLGRSLTPVRTPIGDAWILTRDEPAFREPAGPPAAARLLPSGDTFYLLWGAERELLVPDAQRRGELWTPRVWPGALLVDGEVAGTWRRDQGKLAIVTWRRLTPGEREAVEAEAASLPLPGVEGKVSVGWGE